MKSLELKIPPLLLMFVFALIALLIAWPLAKASNMTLFSDATLLIPAVVIFMLGLWVASAGVVEFRKHETTVDPVNASNASAMVTSGIYKRTRNPMYVGFALMLAAWCLALGVVQTLWLLPLFVLYLDRFQIKPEEQILIEKFPDAFSEYRHQVGRWWGR